MSLILDSLNGHIAAVKQVETLQSSIIAVADYLIDAFQAGNKVLLMGNGGSAADAQHIAAELVGRYNRDRKALPALALTTDTSILTALGNDFGAASIFTRQIEAFARSGDCIFAISTSGNSANVIEGVQAAREIGCHTFGLLGNDGGRLKGMTDIPIVVASSETPRIQECHILIGHIICDLVERGMAENER